MDKISYSRKDLPKLILILSILLIVVGSVLWGFSFFMLQQQEQKIKTDLPIEEVLSYQSSFSWWKDAYDTSFLPISILLIVLGAVTLVSRQMWLNSFRINVGYSINTNNVSSESENSVNDVSTKIRQSVLKVLREDKPDSVEQLVKLVKQETKLSENIITVQILSMQNEGKVKLSKRSDTPKNVKSLFSFRLMWYWALLILMGLIVVVIFYLPEDFGSEFYLRQFIGAFFVLFAPGFAIIQTLYPKKELDSIAKISLSIATSMGIVSLTAFLLNFSPWTITLETLVTSISFIILLFATVGVLRGRTDN